MRAHLILHLILELIDELISGASLGRLHIDLAQTSAWCGCERLHIAGFAKTQRMSQNARAAPNAHQKVLGLLRNRGAEDGRT